LSEFDLRTRARLVVERLRVLRGELEPGEEIEGLAEVAAVAQPACHR